MLSYKKTSRIILAASLALVVFLSARFAVNRLTEPDEPPRITANNRTRRMTLDDVRAIAQKIGPDLTMGDLRDFIGEDVGSGIFIMKYQVENSIYILLVGSSDWDKPVMYARLVNNAIGKNDDYIDIRYYDVDQYITNGTKELVRPLPESENNLAPPELDVLSLDYPSFVALDTYGTAAIYTDLDEMVSFITRVNQSRGLDLSRHTKETAANDVKYMCEIAVHNLMRLNDNQNGNISYPELEADEYLAQFFESGNITYIAYFDVLLLDRTNERITVIANVEFDNRDGCCGIAFDFHMDMDYPLQRIYLVM